jgi:hypothetical protein
MPARAVVVIDVYLLYLSCGAGKLVAKAALVVLVIEYRQNTVVHGIEQSDNAGEGQGAIKDCLGNAELGINLRCALDGVEVTAPYTDNSNEQEKAYLSCNLSNHIGLGSELVFKNIDSQVLTAAIDISTAEHNHPNERYWERISEIALGALKT